MVTAGQSCPKTFTSEQVALASQTAQQELLNRATATLYHQKAKFCCDNWTFSLNLWVIIDLCSNTILHWFKKMC